MTATITTQKATTRQVQFMGELGKEMADMTHGEADREMIVEMMRVTFRKAFHDKEQASKWISSALETKREWNQADRIVPDGIHMLGDSIYKVKRALYGSGLPYALVLTLTADGKVKFVKEDGAIKSLSRQTVMGIEDAQHYGKIYGVCLRCSRPLTDEESIKRGLGPECYKILLGEEESLLDH